MADASRKLEYASFELASVRSTPSRSSGDAVPSRNAASVSGSIRPSLTVYLVRKRSHAPGRPLWRVPPQALPILPYRFSCQRVGHAIRVDAARRQRLAQSLLDRCALAVECLVVVAKDTGDVGDGETVPVVHVQDDLLFR